MAKSGSGTVVERRRERWRELLRRWRASGLSQAEFCRRHGVAVWKLAWWKRRLGDVPAAKRHEAGGMASEVPFVSVGIMSSASVSSGRELELVLHGGRLLRFDVDVDATKLATVVTALEGIAAGTALEGASGGARRC